MNNKIDIILISNIAELEPFLPSLCKTYQIVFSTSPYNERFYPNEVDNLMRRHIEGKDQSTILVVKEQRVIGFGLASPVNNHPDISRRVRGLLPIKQTYYIAEIGILPDCRRKGLGQKILEQHMKNMDPEKFNYIVLRSSISEDPAHFMFQKMGFEDMGVYMDIHSRKTDGATRIDHRALLSRMVNEK